MSRIPLVDLVRQYKTIQHQIDEAIAGVLHSGRFIIGENVKKFEQEFARYCGRKYGVGVASGTDALYLALHALDIGPGDEVMMPSFTFVACANAVTWNGAKPVFADIEPETYTLDPEKVKSNITPRTKAILPVHLYGHPADMKPLQELAERRGLHIVEDAAQAHGALYMGEKAGSLGTLSCFSFYPSKNLGAYGDAGIVLTDDSDLADRLRLLRDHGQASKYKHTILGTNSRLDEIQAAILRVKLKHLDQWNRQRRRKAQRYQQHLSRIDSDLRLPVEKPQAKHVYYLYTVATKARDQLKDHMNRKGVQTDVHYPTPIHMQKAYKEFKVPRSSLPVTEKSTQEVLSIPLFPELKDEELDYVSSCVGEFFREKRR